MSELRRDPIVGRWVIVAKNRADRPQELAEGAKTHGSLADCPFCEGNERLTTGEVAACRPPGSKPNAPGWQVRVVPNKYPALKLDTDPRNHAAGMYDVLAGVGTHEVIIESPRHLTSTTQLTAGQLRDVLLIYRERLLDLRDDRRLVYGMIFKNVGAAAGASLEHTHSQLIVTPIVPISVTEEIEGSGAYYESCGRCVYCDIIERERAAGQRIVVDSPEFVAFCPFAGRFPFETWIVPTSHDSHYESLSRDASESLARVLLCVLGKIESALDRPAYNYIVHTTPFDTPAQAHYHWHIEIIPRVTKIAGFEWGTGFYINPVPPEEAATIMRDIELPAPE